MRSIALQSVARRVTDLLLAAALLALAGSCAEQSTDPDSGLAQLRIEVRYSSNAARPGGEEFFFTTARARAFVVAEEPDGPNPVFETESDIEPGDTTFRLELAVRPADLYRVEVGLLGSVDAETNLGGILFFGREDAADVRAGADNVVTVVLSPQFPEVGAEITADDRLHVTWTEVPEAVRYRIRMIDEDGRLLERPSAALDTVFTLPPRIAGGEPIRLLRVRAEFPERSPSAYSRVRAVTLGNPTAPGEIDDLHVTEFTDSTVTLAWTATGDDLDQGQATAYDLRRSLQPIDASTFDDDTPVLGLPAPAPAGTAESFTVGDLEANTLYYFGLRAIDDVPLRSPIALAAVTTLPEPDRTPPEAVADLRVTDVAGRSARLLWTAPGDDGVQGRASRYDLRISDDPIDAGNFEQAVPIPIAVPRPAGSAESTLLVELTPRTTYFVALRSFDEEENGSAISNLVQFETADVLEPEAVADLEATALDENRVELRWSAPADDDGSTVQSYEIRWDVESITPESFEAANPLSAPSPSAPGSAESLVASGYERESTLFFALRSFDAAGNGSPLSNVASTRTPDQTAPARIADFTAATTNETTVRLAWTAPGDDDDAGQASSYDLRLSLAPIDEGNFSDATRIAVAAPQPAGSSESVEVSGLVTGQLYYFRIRCADDAGNASPLSDLVSAIPLDAIAPAPVVLSVEATTPTSVTLAWIAPGDDGNDGRATRYDLRHSTFPIDADNFGQATPVVGLPDPALAGTPELIEAGGLDPRTTYYFGLVSEDEAKNRSALSNVVSATTGANTPAAPTDLAAAPTSATSIRLVWLDNADNEDAFEVERRGGPNQPSFERIATLPAGEGSVVFDDVPVLDRTTYTYRVRATNAGGASDYSNEASATTPVPTPGDFAAAALAHDQIRLTWTFPTLAPEGFRIERFDREGWVTIATLAGNVRQYIDTGLTYLTTYTYRMLAFDGNLSSDYTPEVNRQTPDEPPFCSIDPPGLEFGTVFVGEADTLYVRITNTGGQVLLGDVFLDDCNDFLLFNGSGLNLRRGEFRDVGIVFAPGTPGGYYCLVQGPGCSLEAVGVGEINPNFWSENFGPAPGGLGVNGTVRAFDAAGSQLYVGGAFTSVGTIPSSYTAIFSGSSWISMGSSLNDRVRTLLSSSHGLYCGGDFTDPGFGPHHFAYWNGSFWESLPESPDGIVRALTELDQNIIVGGDFTEFVQGGDPTDGPDRLARWVPCLGTGSRGTVPSADRGCNFYDDLSAANPNGTIEAVAVWQGELYVGGSFTQIAGQPIAFLARYNFESWFPVGPGGVNGPVFALYPAETELWVGGSFSVAGGLQTLGVASWSGTSWIPRSGTLDFRTTYAISQFRGDIVIGGSWIANDGVQLFRRIAQTNGSSWFPLGDGLDGASGSTVHALREVGPALYVGGAFALAGGKPSQNIARWEPPFVR